VPVTSDPSRERWNRRWAGERAHARTAPSRVLVAETADLPPGRALDLACGAGRNAVWLAERGWRSLAARSGVEVEWVEADVVGWAPPPQAFDLVVVLYLQLPAAERRMVLAQAVAAVGPGGTLLVVGHDLLNLTEGWGGPTQPDVLFTPEDVVVEIGGLEVVKALRVRRTVEEGATSHEAIDALVVARRPPPG
jgi:SAM-dependent methyltransferase